MKVLLINGSPRKKGNTFLALSEAAKTLEQQGVETEIVHIGVKPVRGCIACAQCVLPWKKLTHRSQHYEVLSNRKTKTLLRQSDSTLS